MIVRSNLNAGYYKLAKEALKDLGKEIAHAKAEKDVDKLIDLITHAKDLKHTFKYTVAKAKKYATNDDGTDFCWL
ncbi:MAG: hypothetical protein NHB14_20640 [Desulfosporosinus sp.]|nr:hypothetical protein [Desulfosporosinus sp.]